MKEPTRELELCMAGGHTLFITVADETFDDEQKCSDLLNTVGMTNQLMQLTNWKVRPEFIVAWRFRNYQPKVTQSQQAEYVKTVTDMAKRSLSEMDRGEDWRAE